MPDGYEPVGEPAAPVRSGGVTPNRRRGWAPAPRPGSAYPPPPPAAREEDEDYGEPGDERGGEEGGPHPGGQGGAAGRQEPGAGHEPRPAGTVAWEAGSPGGDASAGPAGPVDPLIDAEAAAVEADFDLAKLARERDEYLDALRRLQADFENYKKRMLRLQTENLERAAEALVVKLLPVFDTADLAVSHAAEAGDGDPGFEAVRQMWSALFDALAKEGLERIDPAGSQFDPTEQDAVMHEPGDGDAEVVDVLRAGYRWKGRVLRPAMVKVKGG